MKRMGDSRAEQELETLAGLRGPRNSQAVRWADLALLFPTTFATAARANTLQEGLSEVVAAQGSIESRLAAVESSQGALGIRAATSTIVTEDVDIEADWTALGTATLTCLANSVVMVTARLLFTAHSASDEPAELRLVMVADPVEVIASQQLPGNYVAVQLPLGGAATVAAGEITFRVEAKSVYEGAKAASVILTAMEFPA